MERLSLVLLVSLVLPAGPADPSTLVASPQTATATSQAVGVPAETKPDTPDAQSDEAIDDAVLEPAQPEFTIVNLPTTLAVPRHRMAFRATHRFARDLTEGDFGDLLADFFGFDGGAQIGLELRFGIATGWQAGVYRTSDRTIQLFTQYSVLRQRGRSPVGLDALAAIEGTNNFDDDDPRQPTGEGQRSPTLGVVLSRVFGQVASVNATLAWIGNSHPLPGDQVDDDDTVLAGVGGRLRIRPTVYIVGEIVPRMSGYRPGTTQASFGIEKRVGGHAFQVNVSNGLGSTPGQIARGGFDDSWYIGFNINRKFF